MWGPQPRRSVLPAVFKNNMRGNRTHGSGRVGTGSGNGAPSTLASFQAPLSRSHGGGGWRLLHQASLLDTCLAGGGVVFTVRFTSFLLHSDVALHLTHSLLASGFMLLRLASLPDLISIKQPLSSAPAICSTGCVQWVSGIKNTQGGRDPRNKTNSKK